MRVAAGGLGSTPRKLKQLDALRCDFRPILTVQLILAQNDIELLCDARGSLTAHCSIILRSEIKAIIFYTLFSELFFKEVSRGRKEKKNKIYFTTSRKINRQMI
jgi:hypothetical protein